MWKQFLMVEVMIWGHKTKIITYVNIKCFQIRAAVFLIHGYPTPQAYSNINFHGRPYEILWIKLDPPKVS